MKIDTCCKEKVLENIEDYVHMPNDKQSYQINKTIGLKLGIWTMIIMGIHVPVVPESFHFRRFRYRIWGFVRFVKYAVDIRVSRVQKIYKAKIIQRNLGFNEFY